MEVGSSNESHDVEEEEVIFVKEEVIGGDEDIEELIEEVEIDEHQPVKKKSSLFGRLFGFRRREPTDQNHGDDGEENPDIPKEEPSENPSVDTSPIQPKRLPSNDEEEGCDAELTDTGENSNDHVEPKQTTWFSKVFGRRSRNEAAQEPSIAVGGIEENMAEDVAEEKKLEDADIDDVESPNKDEEVQGTPKTKKSRDIVDEEKCPLTFRSICLCITLSALIIIAASLGTGYAVGVLLLDKNDAATSPTDDGRGGYTCPSNSALLNVSITFGTDPMDVGIELKDQGAMNARIWGFEPGSFRSATLNQLNNLFQICLNNNFAYQLSIQSEKGIGLVSALGSSPIFGRFELAYGDETFFRYNGNCDVEGTNACGAYCSCNFTIVPDGPSGACTSDCPSTL